MQRSPCNPRTVPTRGRSAHRVRPADRRTIQRARKRIAEGFYDSDQVIDAAIQRLGRIITDRP
jgi:hypothetical protein